MCRGVDFLMAIIFLSCLGNVAIPQAWAETAGALSAASREDTGDIGSFKDVKEIEKFSDDIQRWFNTQKDTRRRQFNDILELKVFQSNVFFGSAFAIFLVLIFLFIGKFLFNVIRDALMATYEKILSLMGRDTATGVPAHHFSPLMTSGASMEKRSVSSAAKAGAVKKLLFCEVMTQFVNPLIKPEYVHKALNEQKERTPKPKVGSLLMEYQVASQQDVDKTLKLQSQYRSKK